MATSIARRSTFLRTFIKSSLNSTSRSSPSTSSSRSANILFPNTSSSRISQSPSRLLRRELSSLLPVHSAIASACLVSRLSSEVSTYTEGISLSTVGIVIRVTDCNISRVY